MLALTWWNVFLVLIFALVAGFGFAAGTKLFSRLFG